MTEYKKIVSVHPLRRTARKRERELQLSLTTAYMADGSPRDMPSSRIEREYLEKAGVPDWGRGVRVEKAGFFQWAVVATENRGR